ncbi:hypothetical protein L9F63_024781 [Diploptera punctata]|uniref:Uncharacterized protein n=1 Tax=Diploptera punctata TaxID=6984 RepID=A0AAD7ZF25_DIPPU|nr:hypothetical protein L9F63_024781 [Diploptera punctata]
MRYFKLETSGFKKDVNISSSCHKQNLIDPKWEKYIMFSKDFDDSAKVALARDMVIHEEFLSEEEEKSIFQEVEPYMKKLRYEFAHWDDAIHGYRETERDRWTPHNTAILDRVRRLAFPTEKQLHSQVHVLDLSEKGYIKPHVDSIRFCGNTIAGLSLLSDSVMRLNHEKEKMMYADFLLKRRSLYIMKDVARYDYNHEILGADISVFRGEKVPRGRRISVICRNRPESAD